MRSDGPKPTLGNNLLPKNANANASMGPHAHGLAWSFQKDDTVTACASPGPRTFSKLISPIALDTAWVPASVAMPGQQAPSVGHTPPPAPPRPAQI